MTLPLPVVIVDSFERHDERNIMEICSGSPRN
jgi:hypothetical protein